jgi:hypothetical protein
LGGGAHKGERLGARDRHDLETPPASGLFDMRAAGAVAAARPHDRPGDASSVAARSWVQKANWLKPSRPDEELLVARGVAVLLMTSICRSPELKAWQNHRTRLAAIAVSWATYAT